jgi:hypothetical protein
MKCNLLLLVLPLLSFSLYSCGQSITNSSNNYIKKNSHDTILFKQSNIQPLIDTSFTLEPRAHYTINFDSLNFEIENEDSTGIYTFRGNNQRNSPVVGILSGRPTDIINDWIFTTGVDTTSGIYGVWGGGAGWTGQPLYIEWSLKEIKESDGILPEFKNRDSVLKEIIQVSLCGKIYFIDLETGKPTRKPFIINNPIKGTPSIDRVNRKYLLSGQGIQNRGYFAWRIFDLRKQTLLHTEIMPSDFAGRKWGASDAAPLIDGKNNLFVWPTESGIIYRGHLADQDIQTPEQYRYIFPRYPKQGTESSPSAYKNLGYITDNNGNVFCIDMRSMQPRWHFFNTDDTDGSPVIEVEQDTPYVYIGNEVDLQGSSGKAYLRKLNGLTGKVEWQYERVCYSLTKPQTDNGGMLSTPALGIRKAKGLLWTIFSRVDLFGRGSFVCIDTQTGKLKYEIPLNAYSWVSPIAMYDSTGNAYIYFSDVKGNIFLIDGESGEIIFKENLDYIFESSPIAIGNRIIQPARGNRILCFIIR